METNEQEIALILRDALDAFARARGNGDDSLAYQYVVARYSWMDGKQREEKIDQVMRRVDLAKRLYTLSLPIAGMVVPVINSPEED